MPTPDEVLQDVADFFKERNAEYGDAYKRHGEIMNQLFPKGVTLLSPQDFFCFHIIVMNVVKITRACNAFDRDEHHDDSWKDQIVYAAMYLSETTKEK